MTHRHHFTASISIAVAAVSISITGCAPSQAQLFRHSFLPPAPASVSADDVLISEQPPVPASGLYLQESPNLLPKSLMTPRASGDSDDRLRRSAERYAAGQRAYQDGNVDEARREFNRAIDILLAAPENVPDRQRIERRLDKLVDSIYRYDVNGLGSGEDADKVVYDRSPLDTILELTFPIDPRLKMKVKEEIAATSSQLPLEATDAVLSYVHFFSTDSGRKILSYGMKRSGRYRSMIQRVLAEENVPQELIYLAQIESAFSPRAISRKRCVGMWQFSSWDGKNRGLNQNQFVDERMDPEKSTQAAAKHLHELYDQLGDWYLAMAAYNCGPACVDRAVQRTGYADFWKLRDIGALPKETTNYVPVIVAITIMMKNPKDYGLDQIEMEPTVDYETVKLEAATNMALIADATERPITELRELNPALLRGIAPAGYEFRLPKGTAQVLASVIDSIPADRRANWRVHKVEPGETIAAIAKRFRTPAAAIAAVNNNTADGPSAGDVLIIPASYQEKAAAMKLRSASSRGPAKKTAAGHKSVAARKAVYTNRVPAKVLHKRATVKTAALR
jgi:membrane-bound lytic murein transglycosylase D